MPIDHRGDVHGGGLLDGDEVKCDETTNDRNSKLKAITLLEALEATAGEG